MAIPGPEVQVPHCASVLPHASFVDGTDSQTSPSSSVSTPSGNIASSLLITNLANRTDSQEASPPSSQSSPMKGFSNITGLSKAKSRSTLDSMSFSSSADKSDVQRSTYPPSSQTSFNASSSTKDSESHPKRESQAPSPNSCHPDRMPDFSRKPSPQSLTSQSCRSSRQRKKRKEHHVDIAKYPTPQLLRLLSQLLTQIATSNDRLRKAQASEEHPSGQINKPKGAEKVPPPMLASTEQHDDAGATTGPSSTLGRPDRTPGGTSPPRPDHYFSATETAIENPSPTLCFHARNVPSIAIEPYLFRILRYCPTTNEVFLSLLVYFDRMARLVSTPTHHFAIDSYNLHRLVIAGLTAASKFFSDIYYTNSRYARVGGVPVEELNQLEVQFLLLNDFRLKIPLEEMQRYADQLLLRWDPSSAATEEIDRPLSESPSSNDQRNNMVTRDQDNNSMQVYALANAATLSNEQPEDTAEAEDQCSQQNLHHHNLSAATHSSDSSAASHETDITLHG